MPAPGYAPGARAIAEEGYLVVVVPMPLNFAIFGVDAADGVIAAHPEITHWAIGGHSLGGAMAAQYAAGHPGSMEGLALCGAYSASDLSGSGLAVSSVYGSLDAGAAKIEDPATQALLPATTVYDEIEGGNHEQCGWYTGQPNDPPATISRADQQVRMVDRLAGDARAGRRRALTRRRARSRCPSARRARATSSTEKAVSTFPSVRPTNRTPRMSTPAAASFSATAARPPGVLDLDDQRLALDVRIARRARGRCGSPPRRRWSGPRTPGPRRRRPR